MPKEKANLPKPPENTEVETPQPAPTPVKEKKERSPAQIAASQKALAAMQAKRKELYEKAKEKK